MTSNTRHPIVIDRFYEVLDKDVSAQLTPEQKEEIENAIVSITLATRHRIDIRKSFPFFGKRLYMVFLLGRDLRARSRPESKLSRIVVTFLILFATLFLLCCVLLTLQALTCVHPFDTFVFREILGLDPAMAGTARAVRGKRAGIFRGGVPAVKLCPQRPNQSPERQRAGSERSVRALHPPHALHDSWHRGR